MMEDQPLRLSPKAKRVKQSSLADEKENTVIEYVVPVFTGRYVSCLLLLTVWRKKE